MHSPRWLRWSILVGLGFALVAGLACALPAPPAPASAPSGSQVPSAPQQLKIALVNFMSGPGGLFGVGGINAGTLLIEQINATGGVRGVKGSYIAVDEAGGVDKQISEYRRLVVDEGVDAVIGYTSSGDCLAIAPVAEELKTLTILAVCGTVRLFEEGDYKYVFRSAHHLAVDNLAAARYVVSVKPDLKTIAGINPDYAWSRDSWEVFTEAVLRFKPDVQVADTLWPKLFQGEYSAEISKLLASKPDVIHTALWGGDMDSFIRQAGTRGLFQQSSVVFTVGEEALLSQGKDLAPGLILGGQGYLFPSYPDPEKNP